MRPLLLAFLAALFLGLITFAGLFFRPKLIVTLEPATATVSFAGITRQGSNSFTVWPGRHELTIEEDGYIPLKRTEKLGIGERINLTVTLKPIPKPTVVTDESVYLVGTSSDGESVLYIGNSGKTLYAQNGGEQKALTPDSFNQPVYFAMSPSQDVAILKNANGEYFLHDFKRYNLVEQQQLFYGRDITDIDWLYPETTKLLYSYAPAGGERSIIAADRTNKGLERIFNLRDAGITDPTISVSSDGKFSILVSRPGNEFSSYNMYLLDLFTKRARQLTTDGSKTDAIFSPSGKYIVYTRFEEDPDGVQNQMLSVMDADGKNRKDFAIRANLDQIAFLDDTRIAVTQSTKSGSKLVRINLATSEVIEYSFEQIGQLHFSKLALSLDKKSAYVTASESSRDQYGKLYIIDLETSEYQ